MIESGKDSFCVFGEKTPTHQATEANIEPESVQCPQELHLDPYAPPSLDVSSLWVHMKKATASLYACVYECL